MGPRFTGRRHRSAPAFFGLLLVIWGALALLDMLGFVELRLLLRTYWPLLIVGWGVSRLISTGGDRWTGILAIVIGGIFLGNQTMGWHINPFRLWPLFVIFVGMRIMFRGSRDRWPHQGFDRLSERMNRMNTNVHGRLDQAFGVTPLNASVHPAGETASTPPDAPGANDVHDDTADTPDPAATLREFALLGGVERRNTSQTFRGGDVTAVLGGVEIDLRECRMAGDEAHLDVFACMGGISLRIPRDWTVESRVEAILGGFEDQSARPLDGTVKRLVIRGQAIMGGIEIKN